jgi:hypothetical protein
MDVDVLEPIMTTMRSLTLTLALAGLPAVLAAQAPVRNAPVRLEEPRRDRADGRRDLRDERREQADDRRETRDDRRETRDDRREARDDRRETRDDRRDGRDDRRDAREDDRPRSTGAPILKKRKP